jgi:hypothetical protein
MNVIDAARNVAEDYEGGASALALRIDKNPTTLLHELNETGTAKLGLVTAVKMSARAKDPRILNAFALQLGYMVLPLPEALAVEGNETMQDLAHVAKEFAEVIQEVTSSYADDGRISENELAKIEKQFGELLASGQSMLARIRASHEQARPAHLREVARGG